MYKRCSQCGGILKGYFQFTTCSSCYRINVEQTQQEKIKKGKL